EIDVDDVLILLGWVLGVFDRAVRPEDEPLRMLLDPGMVRRALDREIERDLHRMLASSGDEAAEVVERPQLRIDGTVAALGGADRVRAAGIAGLRRGRIVTALAVDPSDRVDRHEIDHIEAELGDLR